jgi:hypothetical protein
MDWEEIKGDARKLSREDKTWTLMEWEVIVEDTPTTSKEDDPQKTADGAEFEGDTTTKCEEGKKCIQKESEEKENRGTHIPDKDK